MDKFYEDVDIGFIAYRTPSIAYNVLDEDGNLQFNEITIDYEQVAYATTEGRGDIRFIKIVMIDGKDCYAKCSLIKLAEAHVNYLKVHGSYLVNMRCARRFNSLSNIFIKTILMKNPKLIKVSREYQQEVSRRIRKRYRSFT